MKTVNYKNINIMFFFLTAALAISFVLFICFHDFFLSPKLTFGRCYFHEYTHLYCPGCGGTRAFKALLSLHFIESLLCNPLVLYMAGLFLYYYAGLLITLCKHNGKRYLPFRIDFIIVFLILIGLIFIIRNLLIFCGYDYLGECIPYWQ